MAVSRPNYTSIYSQAYTDAATGLGNQPIARFSILGSLVRSLARMIDSVYGYIDNRFKNAVPYTATGTDLDAWSALWGVYRLGASSATGSASFVLNAAATIPAGSIVVGANSVSYSTTADAVGTGPGSVVVALVTAQTGAATNAATGTAVTLSTPVIGVIATGTMISMTGGSDPETDPALFARAQSVRANPPQGGAYGDYVAWATNQPPCTAAWVDATPAQPGQVVVYIMCDGNVASSGFPIGRNGCSAPDNRGTAATGDQLTVANALFPLRPVTAFVQVVAPNPTPINVTLSGANDTSLATQAAVTAALQARLLAIRSPLGMTVYESDLTQAISTVLTTYNVLLPAAATTIPVGSIPVLGTLTFA